MITTDNIWRIQIYIYIYICIKLGTTIEPRYAVESINKTYQEHLATWIALKSPLTSLWHPHVGLMKINFEIATGLGFSMVAVIGRNDVGDVLFAQSFVLPPMDSLIGET